MSKYLYLIGALIAIVYSIYLFFTGNQEGGVFVAIWAPTILILGLFINSLRQK